MGQAVVGDAGGTLDAAVAGGEGRVGPAVDARRQLAGPAEHGEVVGVEMQSEAAVARQFEQCRPHGNEHGGGVGGSSPFENGVGDLECERGRALGQLPEGVLGVGGRAAARVVEEHEEAPELGASGLGSFGVPLGLGPTPGVVAHAGELSSDFGIDDGLEGRRQLDRRGSVGARGRPRRNGSVGIGAAEDSLVGTIRRQSRHHPG